MKKTYLNWDLVKQHFNRGTDDAIEIYYENMTKAAWSCVFDWITLQPTILVMTAYGYIEPDELDYNEFINGNSSYVVTITPNDGLNFSIRIIEDAIMDCYVYLDEIQDQHTFDQFISIIFELAEVTQSPRYIVCPEERKQEAFIIDGKLIIE